MRMPPAAEIVAEMKARFADLIEGKNGLDCFSCRLTFKIYKGFPDMSHGTSMNVQAGEQIPINSIRALSSGYEMNQALGHGEECLCRDRRAGRFDERFVVKDDEGSPVANVRYRIFANSKQIYTGMTDSAGLTERAVTQGLKFVMLEVER